jgi:hypothetical protein
MGRRNHLTNDPKIATVAFAESAFFSKLITPDHPLVLRLPHIAHTILIQPPGRYQRQPSAIHRRHRHRSVETSPQVHPAGDVAQGRSALHANDTSDYQRLVQGV